METKVLFSEEEDVSTDDTSNCKCTSSQDEQPGNKSHEQHTSNTNEQHATALDEESKSLPTNDLDPKKFKFLTHLQLEVRHCAGVRSICSSYTQVHM